MANLVSVPPGSPLTTDQIATAEALIAAQLGVPTLERNQEAESGTVGASGLISLSRPTVSVQTLTLGGAPAAGILRDPWTLDVSSLVKAYSGGMWGGTVVSTPYAVTYTAGWTAEDLPAAIQAAVLITAGLVAAAAGREGIKSESMGPVSRTYTESGSLSPNVLALLRPWLPLRF